MEMLLVLGSIKAAPTVERGKLSPAVMADLVWSVATATDHLEHVYVTAAPGVLNLALYVMASSPEQARDVGRRLCERAVEQSPVLSGWSCAK